MREVYAFNDSGSQEPRFEDEVHKFRYGCFTIKDQSRREEDKYFINYTAFLNCLRMWNEDNILIYYPLGEFLEYDGGFVPFFYGKI